MNAPDNSEEQSNGVESDPVPVSMLVVLHGLHLLGLRSAWIVGRALALTYPTDELFLEEFLESPEVLAELSAVSEVLYDISVSAPEVLQRPEQLAEQVFAQYGRAREALELLSERLKVQPEDVLAVLVRSPYFTTT